MEQQSQVIQTENFGEIIGILKKKDIRFGTSKATGKNYANGSVEIEITNEHGVNVIKVDVMQMELNSKGESNKAYKALQTIHEEYKTKDENGEDADLIQVFVKIEENNYYVADEDVVKESVKLLASTNFDKKIFAPMKRVADKNTPQKAEISFGGMITRVLPNDTTGELKVEMVGVTYSGKAIKHKLDVSKELAQGFRGIYQEGAITTLHYLPINAVTVKEVKQQVAFGNAPTYTIQDFNRKNLVCGGDVVNYTSPLTTDKVTELLKHREVALEQVKTDALARAGATAGTSTGGFGAVGGEVPQNPFGGAGIGGTNPFGGGTNPFGG